MRGARVAQGQCVRPSGTYLGGVFDNLRPSPERSLTFRLRNGGRNVWKTVVL
jgi:hypothetical protein